MQINENFVKRSKIKDIGRWHITRFIERISQELPAGAKVLDAGAGECAYKPYFQHCDYKAIDLAVGEDSWNYNNLDYIAPLHKMPIGDNSFDAVICTSVLEHLEWPRESVQEMYRVLKPNGKLFLAVPMAHAEHQVPYDFFRYTSYGLQSLCKHAGFSKVTVEPFGGMFLRWAYELPDIKTIFPPLRNQNGRLMPRGLALFPLKAAVHLVVRIIQTIFITIDPLDKDKSFPFGWNATADKSGH